jgi:predicted ATPase
LRDVRLTLGELNVVTGANGSGKSSLFRAMKLLAEIAQGRIIQSLAEEGGLKPTLWTGPEARATRPAGRRRRAPCARIRSA